MSLRNYQDLYVSNLAHRTGVIKDQLDAGMYMLKRVGFFLRKIATSKKNCSQELNKFSDHELEKKERISKDKMHLHVNAYQQMQHVCTQMAFFELKFGTDLLDKVAEPLLLWHKDAEVRLKKLIQAEEKLEQSIAALRARIKTERALCVKGWTDLTKEYREWQKSLSAGDAKKIEKLEKNFLAKREKLRASFVKFEQMVDAANVELRAYWVEGLPAIVSSYEMLEVERCNELEARLVEFKTIQSEYSQPFPGMLAMVEQSVKAINGPKELKGFVDAVVAQGGKPEAPQAFVDGLPTDSRALLDAANQSTLGALLNQDPTALAAQREASQIASCGTVLGSGSAAGATSSAQASSSASALTPPTAAASVSPSSSSLSSPTAASTSASALSSASTGGGGSSTNLNSADPFNRAADPPATFVRALYDFTSDDPDDLTFTLNTVIRVTLKGEDDELAAEVESGQADVSAEPRWWRGQRLENIGKSRDGTFPSNYVRVCGVERDMSLRHLLEIPSGLLVFSDFLRQEYASENIAFWQAVEMFRERCFAFLAPGDSGELREEGREPMLAEAKLIAAEFIGHKAASQVNISSGTLKLTEDRIAALPISLGLNMFDEAASEIMKMLSADSYARFKRHELFDRYLASQPADTATTGQ